MEHATPKVSIGLPVYNGENFLREALDSLLAQTFTDFEIIISDNASTDGTMAICQTYAAQDSRIRYFRQGENLGAAPNYNFVFDQAAGEYFKWAAHDDLCAPEFLEKCVAALDSNPDVVLCYTKTNILYLPPDRDENGAGANGSVPKEQLEALVPAKYIKKYDLTPVDGGIVLRYDLKLATDSSQPYRRFGELIRNYHECLQVFGLIRTDILRRTPRIGSFVSSDRTLLAELALYGPFYEVPEFLFTRRIHPQSSVPASGGRRARTTWFDPRKGNQMVFPNWRVLTEYSKSVQSVPLPINERIRCYGQLGQYMRIKWKGLVKDLYVNARSRNQ